jgi:hypothetical protein
MFPGMVCAECGRKAKVTGVKRNKGNGRYIFNCVHCPNEWEEKINFLLEDNKKDREISSILLGVEIYATAERCLDLIEESSFSALYDEVDCLKNRLSNPKNLQKLKKLEKSIAKTERRCKEKAEKECLDELEYLENLLSELEESWGLKRMKEVVTEYEQNIYWGVAELEDFFEEAEGKCKEEAGKILKYLEAVAKTVV